MSTSTLDGASLPSACFCVSMPMIDAGHRAGLADGVCCMTTSTFSPRAWLRIWAKVGLLFRLMAKLLQGPVDRLLAVVADGRDVAPPRVLQRPST